jgi:hypothetical protein
MHCIHKESARVLYTHKLHTYSRAKGAHRGGLTFSTERNIYVCMHTCMYAQIGADLLPVLALIVLGDGVAENLKLGAVVLQQSALDQVGRRVVDEVG